MMAEFVQNEDEIPEKKILTRPLTKYIWQKQAHVVPKCICLQEKIWNTDCQALSDKNWQNNQAVKIPLFIRFVV